MKTKQKTGQRPKKELKWVCHAEQYELHAFLINNEFSSMSQERRLVPSNRVVH